jgi:uncharacterized protein DUF4124
MKKTLFLSHICLIFTGIFFSLSINAEMYKWVDKDGNTHYSQSPPVDNATVEIIKPPGRVDTESAIKTLNKQKQTADELREDRITAKENKQKAEEEALEKQKRCEQAKKRLASYQRPRVQIKNEDGSQSLMPEEERQAQIKKSQAYVDEACN